MTRKYILVGHTPKRELDLITWAKWFETAERCVALSPQSPPGGNVSGNVLTYFTSLEPAGLDGHEPPLLFETRVTGGPWSGWADRTATWEEAEKLHARVLKALQHGLPEGEFLT